ncbi:MAG: hypothetical protein ACTSRZ_04615 [Promethearchaeota archaeon]
MIDEKKINNELLDRIQENRIFFLMKSNSIKFSNYDLKNVPTSTGRADVIARCIKACLGSNKNNLDILENKFHNRFAIIILFNENFIAEVWNYWWKKANSEKSSKLFENDDFIGHRINNPYITEFGIIISNNSDYFKGNRNINQVSEHELLDVFYKSFQRGNFWKKRKEIYEIVIKKRIYITKLDSQSDVQTDFKNMIEYFIFFKSSSILYEIIQEKFTLILVIEKAKINVVKQYIEFAQRKGTNDNIPSEIITLIRKKKSNHITPLCFILGDQTGFDEKIENKFTKTEKNICINLGSISYLGSSVITFIKYLIFALELL